MNRLLIIITRMYAKRGDKDADVGDEFVLVWGADPTFDELVFSCSKGAQDYHVLVVHGCDYPGDLQRAIEDAKNSVERGLERPELKDKISEAQGGILFHPRRWTTIEKKQLAAELEQFLKSKNIEPAFVKQFSNSSPVETALAPDCRATPDDFTQGFSKTWNYFYVLAKMYEPRHSLINQLKITDQNLQWLKDINFEDSEGALEVINESVSQDMLSLLEEAKRIVMGNGEDDSETIKGIAEQVIHYVPERRAIVEKAMAEVAALFSNEDYEEAKKTLAILNNKSNKPPREVLQDLQQNAHEGKSFLEWYSKLLAAIERLRNELIDN